MTNSRLPVPQSKRYKLSDITNKMLSSNVLRTQNGGKIKLGMDRRLSMAPVYNDPKYLKEISKQETKLVKDIETVKRTVSDVCKEIARAKTENEQLLYANRRCSSSINDATMEINDLEVEIERLTRQIEHNIAQTDLHLSSIRRRHELLLKEYTAQLEQEFDTKMTIKNKEKEEILEFRYDTTEIDSLHQDLTSIQAKYVAVAHENSVAASDYKLSLEKEYIEYKREHESVIDKVSESNWAKREKLALLQKEIEDSEAKFGRICASNIEISEQLSKLDGDIAESLKTENELQLALHTLEKQLEQSNTDLAVVNEEAKKCEEEYNHVYDKMEAMQWHRKQLEDSIEELRGNPRVYVRVNADLNFDYDLKIVDGFEVSKLILEELVPENEVFDQEFTVFMESCIANQTDCRIASFGKEQLTQFAKFMKKWSDSEVYVRCVDEKGTELASGFIDSVQLEPFAGITTTTFELPETKVCFVDAKMEIQEYLTGELKNMFQDTNTIKYLDASHSREVLRVLQG